jgi:uncharacterized protein (TIGR02466 family)
MEKIDIVPRTLLKFSMNSKLLENVLESVSQEKFKTNISNKISENYFLLREERYKELADWINSCLEEIRLDLNFFCDSLKITQSWANRSSDSEYHHNHIHPNSILSGIIYLTESNSPTLFGFENDWYCTTDGDSRSSIKISFDSEKSVLFHKCDSIPGDMIIFPSNFRHSTDCHQSDNGSDRLSISFNVFPTGKIGRYGFLCGLEIEVK